MLTSADGQVRPSLSSSTRRGLKRGSGMYELELAGNVAIVTGGAKGVGRLLADELSSAGAAVAIVGRNEARLRVAAKDLSSNGSTVVPFVADVTDRVASVAVSASVREQLGPIDILVNNAGIPNLGLIETVDPEFWWQAFEVHVKAPMMWCQAVLPEMIQRGSGRIVNVTSTAAVWTVPGGSAYIASKAALSSFTRVLDAEVRPKGILAFAYAPRLRSDMTDHIEASSIMPAAFRVAAAAVTDEEVEGRRQRSIDLFRRIIAGGLDHHAGAHLETESPPEM